MNAPVHLCHRGKSQPNNQAEQQRTSIEILSNSVGTHNQMKPASTIGAKFSRKSFFLTTLGPPQHRTALLTKLYFPLFQLSRPSFAASHQSKPRILDKTCSKLRTQFLLRCLQVWSREPAPVLFMISHHSAFRHRIAACPGWEASFRATCPAHPYTAASALCHRDGRFNLHLNACAERFVARNQSTTERLGLYVLPAYSGATLFLWMEIS